MCQLVCFNNTLCELAGSCRSDRVPRAKQSTPRRATGDSITTIDTNCTSSSQLRVANAQRPQIVEIVSLLQDRPLDRGSWGRSVTKDWQSTKSTATLHARSNLAGYVYPADVRTDVIARPHDGKLASNTGPGPDGVCVNAKQTPT